MPIRRLPLLCESRPTKAGSAAPPNPAAEKMSPDDELTGPDSAYCATTNGKMGANPKPLNAPAGTLQRESLPAARYAAPAKAASKPAITIARDVILSIRSSAGVRDRPANIPAQNAEGMTAHSDCAPALRKVSNATHPPIAFSTPT